MRLTARSSRFRASLPLLLSVALSCLGTAAMAGAAPPAFRRFALVMGANDGGPGLERLRYAASDARSFAAVMTELGGVAEGDLVLLIDPALPSFRGAANRLAASASAVAASGGRCEFVLYYSGHSDDEGLLLGRDRLGYSELRAAIEKVPAAVRVAILDSCSSGSLTRAKGGVPKPAFLYDASSIQEGHAYITSSSADEAAQESDRIGGSFFTHYLVSALRGAADARGEGRVTLNEAYAYSFRETLASTENTQFGPQHPGYEINLTGSGDLVFTDLRSSKAGLALSEELSGTMYVRDSRGNLAVELNKARGDRMELGLPAGGYSVLMVQGQDRYQAEVAVSAGSRTALRAADFKVLAAGRTTARGIEGAPDSPVPLAASAAGTDYVVDRSIAGFPVAFGMILLPDFSRGLYFGQGDHALSLNVLWGGAHDIRGVQLSTLLNADSGLLRGFQLAAFANAVKGSVGGLQLAGMGNLASEGFSGAQIAGGVNIAGAEGRGAQIGVVNIASHMVGAQIGVVNIADRIDGVPIGLINLERGGIRSFQAWTEGASSFLVGYALGTRFIYNLASIGFDFGSRPQSLSSSLGIGGRLSVGPFFGNLDVSWREIYGGDGPLDFSRPQARLEARILAGYPAQGPGLVLGCGLEASVPGLSRQDDGAPVSSFRVQPSLLFGAKF